MVNIEIGKLARFRRALIEEARVDEQLKLAELAECCGSELLMSAVRNRADTLGRGLRMSAEQLERGVEVFEPSEKHRLSGEFHARATIAEGVASAVLEGDYGKAKEWLDALAQSKEQAHELAEKARKCR